MTKYKAKAIINIDINTMSGNEAVDIITMTLRDLGLSGHITVTDEYEDGGSIISEDF
jgi:hypothetical protein